MKARKKVVVITICILLAATIGAGLYTEYRNSPTPDEIQLQEVQDTEAAYALLLSEALLKKDNVRIAVVINPTHGGSDYGIQTEYGTEKDITLAVAQKIAEQNTDANIGIFLTRNTDTNPNEKQRREFADKLEADLYLNLQVEKDAKNTTFGTAVQYQTKFYDDKLTNVAFADILERSTVTRIEGNARGIFEDTEGEDAMLDFTIPAATIQMGYLTNSTEGTLLSKNSYQDNMAAGILTGISQAAAMIEEKTDE